jgi:uncharacterized protein YjbI with pentapeptide repeats
MILGKRGEVCLMSLSRAILGYVDLSDSSLFGADPTNTDLRYADLSDSNLRYVDLTNTTLYLTV